MCFKFYLALGLHKLSAKKFWTLFRTMRVFFSLLNETQKLIHDSESDAEEKVLPKTRTTTMGSWAGEQKWTAEWMNSSNRDEICWAVVTCKHKNWIKRRRERWQKQRGERNLVNTCLVKTLEKVSNWVSEWYWVFSWNELFGLTSKRRNERTSDEEETKSEREIEREWERQWWEKRSEQFKRAKTKTKI